jgi:hypothetical protein
MAKALEKMSNYVLEYSDHDFQIRSCPRYLKEVYDLGADLQYYIGDMYLQLAELSQVKIKATYQKMAVHQLEMRQRIERLNEAHLNEILTHFYNNGGKVVEAPLASEASKELQPFFNRMMDTFLKRLESALVLAAEGSISPEQLGSMIDNDITEMYRNLGKLFQVEPIVRGFEAMIRIRENLR